MSPLGSHHGTVFARVSPGRHRIGICIGQISVLIPVGVGVGKFGEVIGGGDLQMFFEGEGIVKNPETRARIQEGKRFGERGDFAAEKIINRGVHEPVEEFAFQECLKVLPHYPTMLELGAYWAHYSMWLKLKRPNATVTMVEPDERNLRTGVVNFKLNNYY